MDCKLPADQTPITLGCCHAMMCPKKMSSTALLRVNASIQRCGRNNQAFQDSASIKPSLCMDESKEGKGQKRG